MEKSAGTKFRAQIEESDISAFIGVYDVFSASLAARHYDGVFLSGFSFAASYYGLPDIGFIAWPDMVSFAQRIRTVLPETHILVDIDDGYADTEVACHVTALLESVGVSGIIIEDQLRPRRCGHFDGKQLMDLKDFLNKLQLVLQTRRNLFVVARTDSSDLDDACTRAHAFADAGADAILIDGLKDLGVLRRLRSELTRPLMFNQIAGGKSPPVSLTELKSAGVSLVNYSTPCLFSAQVAIERTLMTLKEHDGNLSALEGDHGTVASCTEVLSGNLKRRDTRSII